MKQHKFLVVGGDKRQKYLFELLKEHYEHTDFIFGKYEPDTEAALKKLKNAENIIFPVPVSQDRIYLFTPKTTQKLPLCQIADIIPENTTIFGGGSLDSVFKEKSIKYIDFLGNESMTMKNAMATAEAALSIIISSTEETIFGRSITIMGYGRIGKILANYLKSMHAVVTVCARRSEVRTQAYLNGFKTADFSDCEAITQNADIIINTVPHMVIDKRCMLALKKQPLIIDLASKPGGVDFAAANELEINAVQTLSLPGKYSPLSAAEFMFEVIEDVLS